MLSAAPSTWMKSVRPMFILPVSIKVLMLFQVHVVVRLAPTLVQGNTLWRCNSCLQMTCTVEAGISVLSRRVKAQCLVVNLLFAPVH